MKNGSVKKNKQNLLLKISITLVAMYVFYKLPSIIADKGYIYYNKHKGDLSQ